MNNASRAARRITEIQNRLQFYRDTKSSYKNSSVHQSPVPMIVEHYLGDVDYLIEVVDQIFDIENLQQVE